MPWISAKMKLPRREPFGRFKEVPGPRGLERWVPALFRSLSLLSIAPFQTVRLTRICQASTLYPEVARLQRAAAP